MLPALLLGLRPLSGVRPDGPAARGPARPNGRGTAASWLVLTGSGRSAAGEAGQHRLGRLGREFPAERPGSPAAAASSLPAWTCCMRASTGACKASATAWIAAGPIAW